MTDYRFLTRFVVSAPRDDVFDAVLEPEPWLPTLRHIRRLRRINDGDPSGVGRTYTTEVGTIPYRLRWCMEAVEVERPTRFAWQATGDLAGRGRWTLTAVAAGTLVTSTWHVRPTRTFMRGLAPVARPLFVHNHDRVMQAGAERLADHLGAVVLEFTSTDLQRGT